MCICGWQAIAAVAPPAPPQSPALTPALPPEGEVRAPPQPPPVAKTGSIADNATLLDGAEMEAPIPSQDAMDVEIVGRDARGGSTFPSDEVQGLPPIAGGGGVDGGSASAAVGRGCGGVGGGSGSSAVGMGGVGSVEDDAFADPLKALVRCLCGVVIGRWRQASSAGRVPKKAWVLHAMEGVLALVRALQVSDLTRREMRRRGKRGEGSDVLCLKTQAAVKVHV